MRKALLAAALGTLAVIMPAAAHGQEPAKKPDYEAAKKHYIQAEKAGKAGDWKTAAKEFQIAYDLTGDPVLFYKIADAHDRAGDCEATVRYFQRYLHEAAPTALLRQHVKKRIDACGGDPDKQPDTVTGETGGDTTDTTEETGTGLYVGEVETPAEEPGDSWQRKAGWAAMGSALIFGTAGTVFLLAANERADNAEALINYRDPLTGEPVHFEGEDRDRYNDLIDQGERLQLGAIVAYSAAALSIGAATALFLLDPEEAAGPAEKPGARAAIAPVLGRGVGAQVSVEMTW